MPQYSINVSMISETYPSGLHWAKISLPDSITEVEALERMAYLVASFGPEFMLSMTRWESAGRQVIAPVAGKA